MSEQDEWKGWAEIWQQQPTVDIERLRRRACQKLWRMRVIVVLEILATIFAVGQVTRLMVFMDIEWRWKVWAAMMMVFMLILQGLLLRARRGAWRNLGDGPADALRLVAKRATAGIRLAKVNIWGLAIWTLVTLVVAAPALDPARWQHDPHLKSMLVLQCAVNLPLLLAGFGGCAWYIRRQRRRLREVQALLRDYED